MKVQEKAQALVRRGELAAAVQLLDRYLSEFDGDWGMWLYFAGLNARMAKKDAAIAAYRVCARQLESEGHFARAREALSSAVQLAPHDVVLRHELEEIGRPLRRPRLPDPAIHLTAVIPGRRRRPPPDITDPHCPIFEFLDAERTLS